MKKNYIFITFFMCSVLANQSKYLEEGDAYSKKINYATILNEDNFPFHPSKQEIQDAKIKGAMADINILVVDEAKNPVENAKVSISFKMASLNSTPSLWNSKRSKTSRT